LVSTPFKARLHQHSHYHFLSVINKSISPTLPVEDHPGLIAIRSYPSAGEAVRRVASNISATQVQLTDAVREPTGYTVRPRLASYAAINLRRSGEVKDLVSRERRRVANERDAGSKVIGSASSVTSRRGSSDVNGRSG
jgi:hypothetical protein